MDLSNADHIQKARDAIEEIGRHPWTGLGFDQGLDAHNLLLESANVGGILGVLGFLTIWGTIGALLVRQLVIGVRREHALRASALAALVGYFVLGMLENIIWDRHLWFFITVALFALAPPAPTRTAADMTMPRRTTPSGHRCEITSRDQVQRLSP